MALNSYLRMVVNNETVGGEQFDDMDPLTIREAMAALAVSSVRLGYLRVGFPGQRHRVRWVVGNATLRGTDGVEMNRTNRNTYAVKYTDGERIEYETANRKKAEGVLEYLASTL